MASQSEDDLELGQVLAGFIASLREQRDESFRLEWLADELEQQVEGGEADARDEWIANHGLERERPDQFLSNAGRVEIALRVAYHYLVVLPGMWLRVQHYWRARFPNGVRLCLADSEEPILAQLEFPAQDIQSAAAEIRELVNRLHARFPESIPLYRWLFPVEESHHGR